MYKTLVLFILCVLCAGTAFAADVAVTGTEGSWHGGDVIAVVSYEDDAAKFVVLRESIDAYCKAGKRNCQKLKDSFNETRDLFLWFGDRLKLYIYKRDKRSEAGYNEIKTRYETRRAELFTLAKKAGL